MNLGQQFAIMVVGGQQFHAAARYTHSDRGCAAPATATMASSFSDISASTCKLGTNWTN
jgi:hypothetical protein